MKRETSTWSHLSLVMIAVLFMLTNSCKKDTTPSTSAQVPVLTTSTISGITQSTANCGGNISNDGGLPITVRGLCWGTGQTPTTSDSKTNDGTGAGSFTTTITGLTPNTTYYIRAYATNSSGNGYGSTISFTTQGSLSQIVTGNYSGNGKYMPHLKSLGSNTYDCSVPDWAALLKTGSASATVSSINDSTINIALSGSIYLTGFNKNLTLRKNGNQIFDPAGILKFFIDTKSIQVAYTEPVTVFGFACKSVNSYYYVFEGAISVPPTPRYSYTSIGNWEFNGTK